MRGGGDTNALRAHLRSIESSPTLTDADTVTDGSTCDREPDDEVLKLQMQLTWTQTHLVELKKQLIEQYARANAAEKRLTESAAKASSQASHEEAVESPRRLQDTEAATERIQTLVNDVRARDAKIEQMAVKYEDLSQKHFTAQENTLKMKKDLDARTNDVAFLQARNENLEFDRKELETKLALERRENDR